MREHPCFLCSFGGGHSIEGRLHEYFHTGEASETGTTVDSVPSCPFVHAVRVSLLALLPFSSIQSELLCSSVDRFYDAKNGVLRCYDHELWKRGICFDGKSPIPTRRAPDEGLEQWGAHLWLFHFDHRYPLF